MKKLLIAGGGYADIPLIQAGKALGFHVITSGNRPEDLGHRYSDECRLEDFSDKNAMLRLARKLNIDAICACCNDFSALTAAYVAEQMGLPGHDTFATALLIHHKDRYRHFALDHHISSPLAIGFASAADAIGSVKHFKLPLLVKPVDLTGGKGIAKITHPQDAAAVIQRAFALSKAKRIVLEEFVEGSRHGISTFIHNEKVIFHFHDNEYYHLNPYLVSAASTPGDVPHAVITKLCTTIEHIASLLKLKTGIVHVQYILRDSMEPTIIEICRRAPGDLYTRFVKHATDIDYPAYIVKASAGLDCTDLTQQAPQGFYVRHCIMASRPGRITDVVFDTHIQDKIIDKFMWWKKGDLIDDVMTYKSGIVFLRFATMAEMRDITEQMADLIRIEVE